MKPTTFALILSLTVVSAGTVASANGNKLDIDNDGGGRFSGHAGADWTEEQLRQQVGAKICGGALPRQFVLQILSGYWLFSGTC